MNRYCEDGATSVEYALLTGLIAVFIVGAVAAFGLTVDGLFQALLAVWPG
jgi:Flp pilus assembly pilin Flp